MASEKAQKRYWRAKCGGCGKVRRFSTPGARACLSCGNKSVYTVSLIEVDKQGRKIHAK
jgi:hypothetical protein